MFKTGNKLPGLEKQLISASPQLWQH